MHPDLMNPRDTVLPAAANKRSAACAGWALIQVTERTMIGVIIRPTGHRQSRARSAADPGGFAGDAQ
jgi:hypothetical protein